MEIQTEDKAYSCVQCNLSFETKKDLKTHMLQHGGKMSHSCNQCGFSSIKAANLKRHMLVHSGESYNKYKELLVKTKTMAKQMGMHNTENKCNFCSYSCKSTKTLKDHIMMHTGEKPHKCDQCDYKATQKGTLTVHKRRHSVLKPYSCNWCEFTCKLKTILKLTP